MRLPMRLAALDIGSNTVLMSAVEVARDGTVRSLVELERITRLSRGIDREGHLDPAAAQRTLEAIAEFCDRARELGANRIVACATSAMRDARDGAQFIERVRQATGVELEVISGETEAWLSYLATVKGLNLAPDSQDLLIVDIGGGSTEVIRSRPGAALTLASLRIGSVRLTERILRSDPPARDEIDRLHEAVEAALEETQRDSRPDLMVGIAGTVTTICAVALGMARYDHNVIHGHRMTYDQVQATVERLCTATLEERRRMPGVTEGRADVICAGGIILQRMMAHYGADALIVSDQGVRWGMIYREIASTPS